MITLNQLKKAVDLGVLSGWGEKPVEVYFDKDHHNLLDKVMTLNPCADFPKGTVLLKSEV